MTCAQPAVVRILRVGVAGFVLLVVLAFPSAVSTAERGARSIEGTVHGNDSALLSGQLVFVDGDETTTDAGGRFSLRQAKPPFDVTVMSPDRKSVTVYRGLRRTDGLRLYHHGAAPADRPQHRATLCGVFPQSRPYPGKGTLNIVFKAPGVSVHTSIPSHALMKRSDSSTSLPSASKWGPMTITWEGPPTLSGELFALGVEDTAPSWFARMPVKLQAGEDHVETLQLAQVMHTRRPARAVRLPADTDPGWREMARIDRVYETFAFPGVGELFNGNGGPVGRTYEGPDLAPFGGTTCASAQTWSPGVHAGLTRCKGKGSIVLPLQPAIKAPRWGSRMEPEMRFDWTSVPNAMYKLMLRPERETDVTIVVVTSQTSATLPDLAKLGIPFPSAPAAYTAVVKAIGPYATIDGLTGPNRVTATLAETNWFSASLDLGLVVQEPLHPEARACQYKDALVCDLPPSPGGGPTRARVLASLNRILRFYPEFADAIKTHCVRDCAGARAFMEALHKYRTTHPGFDDDQPFGPVPNPAPPPKMGPVPQLPDPD